jgi:hypothetical protein
VLRRLGPDVRAGGDAGMDLLDARHVQVQDDGPEVVGEMVRRSANSSALMASRSTLNTARA